MPQKISKKLKSLSGVACTEQTYRFNYRGFIQVDKPYVTCLVPGDWLSKNLPAMGGAVIYLDKLRNEDAITDYLFEFAEYPQEQSRRIISLKIYTKKLLGSNSNTGYTGLPDLSIKIHCQIAAEAGGDWHSEVILLNHLFYLYAVGGLQCLKIADFIEFSIWCTEFSFKFGIGDSSVQILSGMTDETMLRDAEVVFFVMFSNENNRRITCLEGAMDVLQSDNALVVYDIALVDQDRMTISLLTGFAAGSVC